MSEPHFLGLPEIDIKPVVTAFGAKWWRQLCRKRLLLAGGTGFVGKCLLASVLEAAKVSELGGLGLWAVVTRIGKLV